MPSLNLSIASLICSLIYFIICCFLPESPCYKYYCDISRKQQCHNDDDMEKDVKLCHLWNEEDLEQKSITNLFAELRKLNLSSLIGLILIEQFIGGISILFYIKYFAQLTGGTISAEWISKTVGLTLVASIPIAKLTKFSMICSSKKQMIISSIIIIVCMLTLAILCIAEGISGYKIDHSARSFLPLPIFAIVTFFYVAGISRNLWLSVQDVFSSFSLQLQMRAVFTATSWLIIFAITKVLPQLLYLVGVGYFYAYNVIFMIISLIYLNKIVPSTFSCEEDKVLPITNSLSASSCESQAHSSKSSSDEIREI
ncbi:hypothetical protein PVAND_000597 [Polypedilum vanderplanki]|uniref:Sugar transporter n=1 Tax=Polypedilum vanderplanki TaxID=319348 RepID=A0A9J6BKA5_POLVA|nr:hypothetical protein PVAND_000597 [Polypedilum vanderplanki]